MATRAMQEATFLILTALADGPQHGYGIITDVRDISGGRVRLRAGTLYTALDRLRADKLIAVDREEVVDGRLRRYYRLTPAGTRLLADEAARLQAHAVVALRRLGLARGDGDMADQEHLERAYRRLLAWYPREFRDEHGPEILAVLMAGAPDGQRRPGLAGSADLIRSGLLMRMRPSVPRSARAVRAAVRLMYAGAAVSTVNLILLLALVGDM
jgi:DNA-binding PadR family transcriptional regulator